MFTSYSLCNIYIVCINSVLILTLSFQHIELPRYRNKTNIKFITYVHTSLAGSTICESVGFKLRAVSIIKKSVGTGPE